MALGATQRTSRLGDVAATVAAALVAPAFPLVAGVVFGAAVLIRPRRSRMASWLGHAVALGQRLAVALVVPESSVRVTPTG